MTQIVSVTNGDMFQVRDVEVGETRTVTLSNLVQSEISTDTSNALTTGSDNKLFVSVSTNGYQVYTALISQQDTGAPTAITLDNTLDGTPVFTCADTGTYTIDCTGAFPQEKTWFSITPTYVSGVASSSLVLYWSTTDSLTLATINDIWDNDPTPIAIPSDNMLSNTPIEIRVYP